MPISAESDIESLIDFVRSLNEVRRDLTSSQRAVVALKMKHLFEKEAKARSLANLKQGVDVPDVEIIPHRDLGKSRDKVAAKAGTNGRYVNAER